MSVLHVISDTNRRGAQVFGCNLRDALVEQGRDSRTVALCPGSDGRTLDVSSLGPAPFARTTLLELRKMIRDSTAVVGHGSSTLPAIAIAGRGTGTPFVYRNIGDPMYWSPTVLRRARTCLLLRTTDRIAALWPAAATSMVRSLGVPPGKIRVIPNGVSAKGFVPITQQERERARERFGLSATDKVAIYAGALSPEKNVAVAMRAVAELPGTHLLVVGAGPDRDMLEALARASATGRMHFTGAIDNPSTAMAAADVLVLPSKSEGLPGVLIEAGFRGLPVVATSVGGVSEIVEDGRTGFVVPPGDFGAFTSALARALAEPAAMGARARERCTERFELRRVAAAWDELLSELEAERALRRRSRSHPARG